jgi:hypothetical protein
MRDSVLKQRVVGRNSNAVLVAGLPAGQTSAGALG